MNFLVLFMLLLFQFEFSYGLTLPREEMLKKVDVYSIQENDHDAITIVNPQSGQPNVKEIIYYHVIEKPYEQSQVMITYKKETVQGPDFDKTRRPFTNGHGLQFYDLDSEEDDNDYEETSDETTGLDEESVQSSEEDDSDEDRSTETDEDMESDDDDTEYANDYSESDDNDENEDNDSSDEGNEDANEDDEDINVNDRISKIPTETKPSQEEVANEQTDHLMTAEAVIASADPVPTIEVDDIANKTRAARNMLFNQLRDRYRKSLKSNSVSPRKKREVKNIDNEEVDSDDGKILSEMPEAPILPKLNSDELPQYARDLISTEEPTLSEMPEAPLEALKLNSDESPQYATDSISTEKPILSEMPEAPILPKLNLDELPQYARDLISTEEPTVSEMPDAPILLKLNSDESPHYATESISTEEPILSEMPEAPILPKLNLDKLPQYARDLISTEEPIVSEMPEAPILTKLNLDELPQYARDSISTVEPILSEMPEAPILPKLNSDESPQYARDSISTEEPILSEMPEATISLKLNSDESPQYATESISTEEPILSEMPEAPILPKLNLDELPQYARDLISTEEPIVSEMPEAPILTKLNLDELPQYARDSISTVEPILSEMPEAPILPKLNSDESPQYARDSISTEEPILSEMPEATILPKLNLDDSPQYARDLISTEEPKTPDLHENNERADKEIDYRIKEMINDTIRPYYEEGEEGIDVSKEEVQKPRTYGMKLNSGNGYVWNDLWSNPGISFNVGDSSRPDEEHEENVHEQSEYDIEPFEKDNSEEKQENDDSRPDLDDIFVNNNNETNGIKETDKIEEYQNEENDKSKDNNEPYIDDGTLVQTERHENQNLTIEKDELQNQETSKELLEEISSYHKNATEQSTVDITEAYDKDSKPLVEANVTQKGKTLEDIETQLPKRIENIIEILNNQDETFWIWLQDWTSTYVDLLMKHIKKIVEQEVRKQLKLSKNPLDHENPHKEPDTYFKFQEDEKRNNKAHTHIMDDSIIIDDDEIPVTHNTNFNISHSLNDNKETEINDKYKSALLKGRRHKEKNKETTTVEMNSVVSESDQTKPGSHTNTVERSRKEGKIDANNIFGNSYNNDKVTNIYIFYPNDDSRKIMKDVNSDKDNNNTFIFGNPEGTKIEEQKPIKEELGPVTENKYELTSPLTLTEETLQTTESLIKDEKVISENTEEKADYIEKDNKNISQSSTAQSAESKEDTEVTDEHNAVNSMDKDAEDVSEKTNTSEISHNTDATEKDNKELSQSSTSPSAIAKEDSEMTDTAENEHNAVNSMDRDAEHVSEKTDTSEISDVDTSTL